MKIQFHPNLSQNTFKGYDARPLDGILLRRDNGDTLPLAQELEKIGKDNGFDVYLQTFGKIEKTKLTSDSSKLIGEAAEDLGVHPFEVSIWTQDKIFFTPNNRIQYSDGSLSGDEKDKVFLGKEVDYILWNVQGGNFFVIKESDGSNSLLINVEESEFKHSWVREKFLDDQNYTRIYKITSPDFHVDMALRPLKDKTILISDSDMMCEIVKEGLGKAEEYLKDRNNSFIAKLFDKLNNNNTHKIRCFRDKLEECFENHLNSTTNPNYFSINKTQKELQEHGFKLVKVPGRLDKSYEDSCSYINYMNAIVHEKEDGSLVYITNKSTLNNDLRLDDGVSKILNFSFEEKFKDAVKDYIAPENVYFVSGDDLVPWLIENRRGGVHCLCAEIPKID